MYKGKKILAIIPARGGSKGLPGKNIRPLLGKPLIGWSIEQAQQSKYIDEIFVSTDSQEIADVAESFGVKVPELRPSELAVDTAPSSAFITYTIEKYKKAGLIFDYIILLEPTSPLREIDDINKSIEMLINNSDFDSIVGVCKAEDVHPSFMVTLGENNKLVPYENEMKTLRRQELKEVYFFEGTVYVSKCDAFLNKKAFYHDKTLPYIVPKWKSPEVDDIVDFITIEAILNAKNKGIIKTSKL